MTIKLTERDIQEILMEWLLNDKKHTLTVPNNISIFNWEADLISLTSTGFFHEYEIKTNLRDYENDFSGSQKKITKHAIMTGEYNRSANYFWFVTSGFSVSWLPHYAGRIEIKNKKVNVLKKAPRLHTVQANMPQLKRAMRSLSYKLYNQYKRK